MKKVWRCGFCGGYTSIVWGVCFTCSAPKDRAQQQWFKLRGGEKLRIGEFAKQYEKERTKKVEAKFGKFWKPKEGENKIVIDGTKEITESTGQYGPAVVLPIRVSGKTVSWMINKKSYSLIRGIMAQVAKGNLKVTVIRTGTGMATRYTVK